MKAPWWVVLCASTSALVLVFCVVLRVHSLPYPRRDGDLQLAKLVCFVSASNEQYDYDSLRTGLCSHILLIDLMGVSKDGGLELLQPSSRALSLFGKLKQRFAEAGDEASFIISIGGVAQKSSHFSKALRTIDSRYALSDELMSFLIKHNLDGIDIAWFYPAQFGGVESDRAHLVVFLEELYLRAKACGTLLSLTVGVDPKDIELSYDVPRINEVVDFVNLLTGDYHNPVAPNHISPLFGLEPKDRFNINYSVLSYIEAGLNPRKIVILNSCYAYLYVSRADRDNPSSTKLKAVMRLSFLTAREVITRECFHTSWDDTRLVPYGTLTKGTTKKWITYNDVESIRRKAEYVLHHQLGGIGLFSIDHDDFGGRAGFGRYPILRAMVYIIHPELFRLDSNSDESVETILCPCITNGTATDIPEYACATISDQSEVGTKQRYSQEELLDDRAISCNEQSFEDVHANQYVNLHDLQLQPYDRPAPISFMDPEDYDSSLDFPFIPTDHRPSGIDRLEPSEMQPCASANNRYMRRIDAQDGRRELLAAVASTGAPVYASKEEPMRQASNVRLHLVSTSNPLEGPPPPPPVYHHPQSVPLQPLVRINQDPDPYSETEPPVVLITPKLSYTRRPTKRPNTHRRSKSRQRSNSGRSGRRSSTTTAPQHVSALAVVEQKTEPTTATATATAAGTVTILSTTTRSAPVAATDTPCTVTLTIPSVITTTTPGKPAVDTTTTVHTVLVTSTEHKSVPETTAVPSTTANYSANDTSA